MSLLRLWPLALGATLHLGGSASAVTYYVAPDGNDTFDGSSTAPWATLQHAVETIAPGDTNLVRSGTYAGCRIRNSGTQAAPKILARDVGATVVVNTPGPQNNHNSLIEIENGSGTEVTDWIVDGLEVANSPHHGIDIRITTASPSRTATRTTAHRPAAATGSSLPSPHIRCSKTTKLPSTRSTASTTATAQTFRPSVAIAPTTISAAASS